VYFTDLFLHPSFKYLYDVPHPTHWIGISAETGLFACWLIQHKFNVVLNGIYKEEFILIYSSLVSHYSLSLSYALNED
jgi:hypothetical protein